MKIVNVFFVNFSISFSIDFVARTGVMLLPAVLSSILLCITYPAVLFDEERVIDPIYNGIFTLVKNRRLKDMADDAYESLIQVTDIFAGVASHLKDFELLKLLIKVLEDHSNPKIGCFHLLNKSFE